LQDVKQGTTKDDLVAFYKALGWNATSHFGLMPSPDILAEGLASGKKYIFGTKLDTVTGFLTNGEKYADHWVTLTDVFQDSSGQIFVKVYNPYQNREEIYTWDYFIEVCNTKANKEGIGPYTYVEAEK
jgi:hypothetical protein